MDRLEAARHRRGVIVPDASSSASRDVNPIDADALWEFSLAFYEHPGVSRHCLALQDEAGADVNLVLALLFAATRRTALGVDDVRRIDRSCARWREAVIQPLRAVRRAASMGGAPDAADVYSTLKSAELVAERSEQRLLARELGELPRPAATQLSATDTATPTVDPKAALEIARANLAAYRVMVPIADSSTEALLLAFAEFITLAAPPPGG